MLPECKHFVACIVKCLGLAIGNFFGYFHPANNSPLFVLLTYTSTGVNVTHDFHKIFSNQFSRLTVLQLQQISRRAK